MGPYCKFCGSRCFTYFPEQTPENILDAYTPGVSIIATCAAGQKFEQEKIGYCYDDIVAAIEKLPIKDGVPVVAFTQSGELT